MENLNYLSFPEKELKEIAEASRNNKLVFFIGAGFSKLSETELIKIPSWGELIDELKEDLGHPAENDYLKIAQLYYLKHGQHAYINKVKKSIVELDPSNSHENLFSLKPKYVITTNWDDLIEKTTKKIGLAYDVISSDEDLAQSQLDKKIIKMHGDFKQHNFVFKEDDYLQYSQKFPLIENYIKGIFSTCTVVFLGYSYSDYNLKQIVSWITNISKSTPKKYLLQRDFDEAQSLYLKNHGVSLLTPHEKINNYTKLYDVFFKSLNIVKDPDLILIEIMSSIERKIESIKDGKKIIDSDDKNKIERLNNFLVRKIMKTLNEKLSSLLQYTVLKPEQISGKFSNCTVNYKYKNEITLEFHSNLMTYDFNKKTRKINEIYICEVILNSNFGDLFRDVASKAGVSHVIVKGERKEIFSSKLNFNEIKIIKEKLLFNFEDNSVDVLFSNSEFLNLLDEFSLRVIRYTNEKNYIMAAINMANFDIVYNLSKRNSQGFSLHGNDFSIDKYKPYNYKNKIIDFPYFIQSELGELIEVINFSDIYKSYYNFSIDSQRNKSLAKERIGNGFSFSDEEYTARNKLYPRVRFMIGNDLIIDNYTEAKRFFEETLTESYEHYLIENKFNVSIMDLFIFIKYFDNNNLKSLASQLSKENKIIAVAKLGRVETCELMIYLISAFENICGLFKYRNEKLLFKSSMDTWLENILVIIGFFKWPKNKFESIMNALIPIYESRNINIKVYDNFQYFLGTNWKLYETAHPSVLKLVDIFLMKIINDKFNGYDHSIIDGHMLNNTFAVSSNSGIAYEKISLVKQAILKIEEIDKELQYEFIRGFFIYIRNIGTPEIKNAINDFIESNILKVKPSTPSDYSMILFLLCNDYDIPEGFIGSLGKFIDENVPRIFSEDGYRNYRLESDLPDYLNFLINERHMTEFTAILDKFNKKIEEAKK
ncbi:TPA: SIR2 family protein [Providencia alcalifaciens]